MSTTHIRVELCISAQTLSVVQGLADSNVHISPCLLCRISCVGIYVASMITGKGPYSLLLEHVQDPIHHNAVNNFL